MSEQRKERSDLSCKIYVGELGKDASKEDLEDIFSKYGTLKSVWVARAPPGFAFVEFDERRDAEQAAKGLDGSELRGRLIRVEMSSGKSRWGKDGPPPGGYRPVRSQFSYRGRYNPRYDDRGRDYDNYRDRYSRRSPDYGRRSPDYGRRSPDYGRRSPDNSRRSPDNSRRSPDNSRRSPDNRYSKRSRSPKRRSRSGSRSPYQKRRSDRSYSR